MVSEDAHAKTYATPAEAARALASLNEADLLRVERFARVRSIGLPAWDWEDLIQEAIARLLSGSRRWPTDVPLVIFLRATIRSLANEERRRSAQAGGDHAGDDVLAQEPDQDPNPERTVSGRDELQRVLGRFADDPEILMLIAGLERGETAAETGRRLKMTPRQYDAARKRFRRAVDSWLQPQEGSHGTKR